jgi:hydrogenase maturation protein HypF
MIRAGLSSPLTTSAGRLFDAVAALCGLRAVSTYEGQAAAELEAAAAPLGSVRESAAYPMPLIAEGDAPVILDARETIRAIVADLASGAAADAVSARFHLGLAGATASACAALAERHGTSLVALGGGAFQNRLLLERVTALLEGRGLRVLLPLRLPPNDGGISYGQAAVAAATDAAGG